MNSAISEEFVDLHLGDKRLNARAIKVAEAIAAHPTLSINAACGSFMDSKAAYRFFDNEKVSNSKILCSHRKQTLNRARNESNPVLVVQDTTDLIYTGKSSISGVGKVIKNPGFKEPVTGIKLHNSLLLSSEGVPLGIVEQKPYIYEDYKISRGQTSSGKGMNKKYPIEQKSSYRWIESARESSVFLKDKKIDTPIIHVADREGDIYEFLQEIFDLDDNFVIRSMSDRRTIIKNRTSTLSKSLNQSDPIGNIMITKEGVKHICKVKIAKIRLKPPQRLPQEKSIKLRELEVVVVDVKEDGRKKNPLHWRLLTNLSVFTFEEALQVVEHYEKRWTIECFHRILKSGYGIEKTRLSSRSKIEAFAAIISIVSWHIFWLYKLSRECPKTQAQTFFDDLTLNVIFISAKKLKIRINKDKPLLSDTVLVIAKLGGYLNRKSDPPPGMQVLWQGWKNLIERIEFMEEMSYG